MINEYSVWILQSLWKQYGHLLEENMSSNTIFCQLQGFSCRIYKIGSVFTCCSKSFARQSFVLLTWNEDCLEEHVTILFQLLVVLHSQIGAKSVCLASSICLWRSLSFTKGIKPVVFQWLWSQGLITSHRGWSSVPCLAFLLCYEILDSHVKFSTNVIFTWYSLNLVKQRSANCTRTKNTKSKPLCSYLCFLVLGCTIFRSIKFTHWSWHHCLLSVVQHNSFLWQCLDADAQCSSTSYIDMSYLPIEVAHWVNIDEFVRILKTTTTWKHS